MCLGDEGKIVEGPGWTSEETLYMTE